MGHLKALEMDGPAHLWTEHPGANLTGTSVTDGPLPPLLESSSTFCCIHHTCDDSLMRSLNGELSTFQDIYLDQGAA